MLGQFRKAARPETNLSTSRTDACYKDVTSKKQVSTISFYKDGNTFYRADMVKADKANWKIENEKQLSNVVSWFAENDGTRFTFYFGEQGKPAKQ